MAGVTVGSAVATGVAVGDGLGVKTGVVPGDGMGVATAQGKRNVSEVAG